MTRSLGIRLRCPKCDGVLGQLMTRGEESGNWEAFVDPVDGARLYRCKAHGRVSVLEGPVRRMRLEAATKVLR